MWTADRPGWTCDAPMAFRRSTPRADHYFVLNDGEARTAWLNAYDRAYASGGCVLEGEPIDTAWTVAIDLPPRSAVWSRFVRKGTASR